MLRSENAIERVDITVYRHGKILPGETATALEKYCQVGVLGTGRYILFAFRLTAVV